MPVPQEALRALAAMVSGQVSPPTTRGNLWPLVIQQAVQHGLAPLLLYRIREANFEPGDAALDPLKQAARKSAAHFAILQLAQAEVEAALSEARITTIWLKGIGLASTLYPEPSLRPMSDLDVMVPYAQREAALKVTQSLGYRFRSTSDLLFSADDPLVQKWAYAYHLVSSLTQAVALELHYHLVSTNDNILPLEQINWFWEHTQICQTASAQFNTLTPTANLIYLCAHAQLQHQDFYLLRYLDLHLLLTHTQPDWSLVIQRAVTLRWTYAVESALRVCVEFFDSPLPGELFEQLRSQRPADENSLYVRALKEKGARWMKVQELLARLSVADQLRLVVRVLFPPLIYMRHRYAIAAGQPVWLYYLYRWLDQAREVCYALAGKRRLRQKDNSEEGL